MSCSRYNNSSGCCALILQQYPKLTEAINECRPDASPELIQDLMTLLYQSLNPIYLKVKCGSVQCCDGLVSSILCAFIVFLSGDSDDLTDLTTTIIGILSLYNIRPNETFDFTGGVQNLVVPANVRQITFDVFGAQGGNLNGGLGGRSIATINVTPGDLYYLYVGGQGATPLGPGGGAGGFNGGGAGGNGDPGFGGGGGGGGASDVRFGGIALVNRIIIAGGGGGNIFASGTFAGSGGGTTGGNGVGFIPGGGGSQVSGGTSSGTATATNGVLGIGGKGANSNIAFGSGGGGGGYYGGGGGGGTGGSGDGGGGSGLGPSMTNGVKTGNGQIIVSYIF